MQNAFTVGALFVAMRDRLGLSWIAGESWAGREVRFQRNANIDGDKPALVGFLNLIRTHQIQIIGAPELAFLHGLSATALNDTLCQLINSSPVCIVADGSAVVPDWLQQEAHKHNLPVWSSTREGTTIVDYIRYFLASYGAERQTLHGVFMEVMGIGVLLAGPAGVGKSELALELVTRGHRLIADDAPEFTRVSPDTIRGTCPRPLQDFLEVRGLGILDIRSMFGDNAIKPEETLRLIVQLGRMVEAEIVKMDRLQGNTRLRKVLDVDISETTLPVIMGSNLAVLVEGAVRNHLLQAKGYNASEIFIARQKRFIAEGEI